MRLYIIPFIISLLLSVNISSSLFHWGSFRHVSNRFAFFTILTSPPVPFNKNESLKTQEPDTLKTNASESSADCSETPNDSTLIDNPAVEGQKISVPMIFVGSNGQIYIISSKDSIP